MNNILAIFFDHTLNISSINKYISNAYQDYFYITDSVSIKKNLDSAIIHYTDIRMRKLDVLITNLNHVDMVYGFYNRIIFYFDKNIIDCNVREYEELLQKIDCLIYDSNHIDIKVIRDVLEFNGEIIDVSEYVG